MRNCMRRSLFWVTLGWMFFWPAALLADDCGSESDCSRAPNNINGATGLAAGGAAAAAGGAAAIARRRRTPARVSETFDDLASEEPPVEEETFGVSWEDVLADPEAVDSQDREGGTPPPTRRGPPDRPLGE